MSPLKILIVEDQALVSKSLRWMLTECGYEIAGVVATGMDAIEKASQTLPDLVLMDIMLKGDMDGIEAAGRIMSDLDIPVVYLTAYSDDKILQRAKSTAPSGYLLKPFSDKDLRSTVEMAVHKHQLERRLRDSEERYRRLAEASFEGILISQDGVIRDANDTILAMTGLDETDIVGKGVDQLTPQDAGVPDLASLLRDRDDVRESWIRHKNGRLTPVEVRGRTTPFEEGAALVISIRDISDRKQAEESRRRRKETVGALLNAISDPTFLVNRDDVFIEANDALAERLDERKENILGRSISAFAPPIIASERVPLLRKTCETGESIRFEDEHSGLYRDSVLYPVRGADGRVEAVAVVVRDVTERKKAEQLSVQAERLGAVADIVSGMAHHFNNLLQVTLGSAEMGRLNLESNNIEQADRDLEQIVESSRFGADVVKSLVEYTEIRTASGKSRTVPVDLSQVVAKAAHLTEPFWKAAPELSGTRIELSTELSPECWVDGDKHDLLEVVISLVRNAVQAMPQGGSIRLKTSVSGAKAQLTVQDDGEGIAAENIVKIFDLFRTTRGYQVLGMGLAVSLATVKRHGGRMYAESSPGEGSVFFVELPALERSDDVSEFTSRLGDDDAPLRILVVDDVAAVVTTLAEGLETMGQTVFIAQSGREAIEVFKVNGVDAVVCDLGMPKMNGWQVGMAIKNLCEGQGIEKPLFVILTGWGGLDAEDRLIDRSGVDAILKKPVDVTEIVRVVGELHRKRIERA